MSVFEAVLLVFTIFTGASIVWSTLASGISPMPSSSKARQAMLQLMDEAVGGAGAGPILELGSGWGNLLIPLAKKYPKQKIIGYELSFVPWLTSIILKNILGLKNIKVYRRNFLEADLTDASIIVCYLFPEAMQGIENKINTGSAKTDYVISNNFSLPSYKPIKTIQLDDLYKSPVYLYELRDY